MSRTDLFARYTQIYQKSRAREIVPEGSFVRQFTDIPKLGHDIGIIVKGKRVKKPRQIYIGNPIPEEICEEDGFLETDDDTYLSRPILTKFKTIDYMKVAIAAGKILKSNRERTDFLKRCQRIIDVVLRKARNVIYLGDFTPFRFDKRIQTLDDFLSKKLKMDDVSKEAAAIPFNIADPEYILLTGDDIISMGDDYWIPHNVFYFVGGIGYTFDKKLGAVNEQRIFRSSVDLSAKGIDSAYLDIAISRVTEDFQNKVHSIIFSDIWKKSKKKPIGVNFGGDLLIKTESSSEIWTGVFEVYVTSPKS